jgi:hypothetical protein
MSLGLVYVQERGLAARQVGKLVRQGRTGVFVFDNPTPYRRLQAFGIAETVLIAMITHGYERVDYIMGGQTYWLTVDEVLASGFRDPFPRPGYIYVKLRDWHVDRGRQEYGWVPSSASITLPWVVNSAMLNARRDALMAAAKEAARPAGIQMGFAAMGA